MPRLPPRSGKPSRNPAHSPADGGPDHGNLPTGPALAAGTGRPVAVFLAPVSYVLVLTPAVPDSPLDSLHGTDHCRFHPHFTRHLSGNRQLSTDPCSGGALDHNIPHPAAQGGGGSAAECARSVGTPGRGKRVRCQITYSPLFSPEREI